MMAERRGVFVTAAGTNSGAFGAREWSMLSTTTLVWGSSYLWISIGLEGLAPGMVAWLRLIIGAATLSLFPAARRRIDRADWTVILVVAIAGNAAPALLFAIAEQTVESAVVGMMAGATPLFTLAFALLFGSRAIGRLQASGLVVGFAGIVALAVPNLTGESAAATGILAALTAVIGYAISGNVVVPLQQRYGGLRVIFAAQAVSAVVMTPFGLAALGSSRWHWPSIWAVAILGVFGTAIARTIQANLSGRVGAPRAGIVGYLVPVVAAVLGVAFRSETLGVAEIVGLGLILLGAALTSRPVRAGPA